MSDVIYKEVQITLEIKKSYFDTHKTKINVNV